MKKKEFIGFLHLINKNTLIPKKGGKANDRKMLKNSSGYFLCSLSVSKLAAE